MEPSIEARALLLAAGALVLSLHVQDAVGVDLEAPGLLLRDFHLNIIIITLLELLFQPKL